MLPVLAFIIVLVTITKLRGKRRSQKIAIPCVYINLENRKDRRDHCTKQLREYFSQYTRFHAVEGKHVDILGEKRLHVFYDLEENFKWDQSIRILRTRKMSHGEIGCCLSHRGVWEYAFKQNMDSLVIFEDDVVLSKCFHNGLTRALAEINTDWDILYLGYIDSGGLGKFVSTHIRKVTFLFGAYAYMLRNTGIKVLHSILPIDRPIDNFLGKMTETNVLQGYAIYPPIANQIEYGGTGSDIIHSAHL